MGNAVVTVAVGNAREWLAVSRPSLEGYANRVNAAFVALTDVTCPPYPMGEKWQLHALFDTYDRILFVDADVVMRPTAPDLFALVPADHVGLYDDYHDLTEWGWLHAEYDAAQREQGFRRRPLHTCYNTGLVVASKSHRDIWKRPDFFRPTHTYEQSLINLKIAEAGYPVYNLTRRNHWQWWSDRANEHRADATILHFAGVRHSAERVRLMTAAAGGVTPDATEQPTAPIAGVCRHRGDEVAAGETAAAGFNPARTHYRCGHPTLSATLPIVTSCRSCGGARSAPHCGGTCVGFAP